jgi:predicted secreted protein
MERGKKIIFVSHCLLNQNARAVGRERFQGSFKDLLELFAASGVGIVQLPCPQLEFNGGLDRRLKPKNYYESNGYKKQCHKLSVDLIKQIENYLRNNYEVIGILGVEQSATCGVHQIKNGRKSVPGKGILIEEIEDEMQKKNFQVPIIGVNLNNTFSSVEKIQNLLDFS